jgi:hypothetical protein
VKAQIAFKTQKDSKFTGKVAYMLGFKFEDGTRGKAWIDEGYRNFSRWEGKMIVGAVLDNLIVKEGGLVDADSFPAIVEMPSVKHTEAPESVLEAKTNKDPETVQMFDVEPIKRERLI